MIGGVTSHGIVYLLRNILRFYLPTYPCSIFQRLPLFKTIPRIMLLVKAPPDTSQSTHNPLITTEATSSTLRLFHIVPTVCSNVCSEEYSSLQRESLCLCLLNVIVELSMACLDASFSYYMCLYRLSLVIILSTRMGFHLMGFGCVFSKVSLSTYPVCKMCVGVETKHRTVVSFAFAISTTRYSRYFIYSHFFYPQDIHSSND